MSSIFNPISKSPYIYVQPARRSWLRIGSAFLAGGVCAALFFRIPEGASEFLPSQAEPSKVTTALAVEPRTPPAVGTTPTPAARAKNARSADDSTNAASAQSRRLTKAEPARGASRLPEAEQAAPIPMPVPMPRAMPVVTDPIATGESTKPARREAALEAATATDAAEESERTPTAADEKAGDKSDEEMASKPAPAKREVKRSRARSDARTVRVLELPDGRRIRVYQDGSDGSALAYGPSGAPRRVYISPVERDSFRPRDFFGAPQTGFWR